MHHTITTLHYRLLEGPVCLEPLRVLQTRTLLWQDRQVTFSVLGASHAVSLTRAGERLTELLACAAPEGALHVLAERPADPPDTFCLELDIKTQGLLCRVQLETFALQHGDRLSDSFPEADQLAYAYPSRNANIEKGKAEIGKLITETTESGSDIDANLWPWTRIGWRIEPDALVIETVHTYPEEGRGIRSRTVFTTQYRFTGEGSAEERHGE